MGYNPDRPLAVQKIENPETRSAPSFPATGVKGHVDTYLEHSHRGSGWTSMGVSSTTEWGTI